LAENQRLRENRSKKMSEKRNKRKTITYSKLPYIFD